MTRSGKAKWKCHTTAAQTSDCVPVLSHPVENALKMPQIPCFALIWESRC